MFSRREIFELAVTGITGGVAAGVVVAGIRMGATADNFLNFCGGAVGAGLAVLGARWLERAKREENEAAAKNSFAIWYR